MFKKLLILVLLLPLASCVSRQFASAKVTLKYKNDQAVIKIDGLIKNEVVKKVDRYIERILNSKYKTVVLDLDSLGGNQGATNRLVTSLETLKKAAGIKFETLVKAENYCMSACTVLFALGSKRIADQYATFMFHYGTGGNTKHKRQANAKTFKPIIKLCGKGNKLSKVVMNPNNIPYEGSSDEIDRICPAYITTIVRFKSLKYK